MEYVQERIATLHDYGTADPSAPVEQAAVVVPMIGHEHAGLAPERVFSKLSAVDPGHVYVALRANEERAGEVRAWIDDFALDATVLWCNAPTVRERLAEKGLCDGGLNDGRMNDGRMNDGEMSREAGKGRDVWLALGVAAASHEYVVVHDADATNYDETHVRKLLSPLARDFDFVKGYYARVEDGQLYGRLFRLLVGPLLRAIDEAVEFDAPILEYLLSFRYALAGEFAATKDIVQTLRVQPGWGLEIGTLGDAFDGAGFERTAQADLGIHRHDHRAVGGPSGLGDMADDVAAALFTTLDDHDVHVDFDTLPERYRAVATKEIDRYVADAAFNDLDYDRSDERSQVATYAGAISPPTSDDRLPAWADAPLEPAGVRDLATDWR